MIFLSFSFFIPGLQITVVELHKIALGELSTVLGKKQAQNAFSKTKQIRKQIQTKHST